MKNYVIRSKIGTGTYGVVYKVTRKDSNQYYVLKQISLFGLPKDQIEEVKMEATILSKLNSNFVVQYYESFEEKNFLNIIMEYCDGGDLGQLLDKRVKNNKRPFEEDFIWKIFIQICLGLGYIHKQKILHRDLKTLNIFLTHDYKVKIGDLGVAKILTNANFAKTFIGTPYYLSPELCEDKPYNEKSDVWALGVILYELCTFNHPFNAKSQAALIKKIAFGEYPPVEKYSNDIKKLVDFILIKDYTKRPSVKDILNKDFVKRKAQDLGFLNDIISLFPDCYNQIMREPSFSNNNNISKKNSNGKNNINKSSSRRIKKNKDITHKIGSRHENPVKIISDDVIYQNKGYNNNNNNNYNYNNYGIGKGKEKKNIMDLGASDFFNNLNFDSKFNVQNFANNLNDYVPQYKVNKNNNKIKDITISEFISQENLTKNQNNQFISEDNKINNKNNKDATLSDFISNNNMVDATVSDFKNNLNKDNKNKKEKSKEEINAQINKVIGDYRDKINNEYDLDSLLNDYENTKIKKYEEPKKETIKKEQPKKIEKIKKGTFHRKDEEFEIEENNDEFNIKDNEEEMVETANFNKDANNSDEEVNIKEEFKKNSNNTFTDSNENSEDETVFTQNVKNKNEEESESISEEEGIVEKKEDNSNINDNNNIININSNNMNINSNNNNCDNDSNNNNSNSNGNNNIEKIKEIIEEKEKLKDKIQKYKNDMCNLIGKDDFDYIMNIYKLTENDDDVDEVLNLIENFIKEKQYSEEKKNEFDNLYYMLVYADCKYLTLDKQLKKYS